MARVLVEFRDRETWRVWHVGDEWEGPPERLETLCEGGYVQSGANAHGDGENAQNSASDKPEGQLDGMTVAELRALAAERGIKVASKATKRQLLEILGG